MNDPGAFSGDTSGTGAEDDSSLTGTLTFTDSIDGDTALNYTVTSAAVTAAHPSTPVVRGRMHRMSTSTAPIPLL